MHRTEKVFARLTYSTLFLLAVTGLLPPSALRAALQHGPAGFRLFQFAAAGILGFIALWSLVAAVRGSKRLSRRVARVLIIAITCIFLGEMVLHLFTFEEKLLAEVYQAYFWRLLVLCVAFPLIFSFRYSVTGISIVILGTGALIAFRTLSASRGDTVSDLVDLTLSFISLGAGIAVVLMLSHTRQAFLQVDREMQSMMRLAQTDPLTEVWNRRRLQDAFREAVEQHRLPLTLILFDIDGFKEINDTYGHDVGDRVLVSTTHLIKGILRSEDSIGRWGGEEFIVLCPGTNLQQGMQIAERLRRAISSYRFEGVPAVTASFGVAQYQSGETVGELVARADKALYVAKETGKNRVEAARVKD